MRSSKLLVLVVLVATMGLAYPLSAVSPPAVHGISFLKGAISPVEVGDPYEAVYVISNTVDTAQDTLTVSSLVDIVHAASGNVSSGNILSSLTWNFSGGAGWGDVGHTFIVLPFGGSAISDPFSFYTVAEADFSLPGHILPDTATIIWQDTCTSGAGNCPVGNQISTTGSQATVTAPLPCVEVTKTADCDVAMVGKLITYTITVTNCGPNPLTKDSISDTLLGSLGGCDTLAVGESCTITTTRTIQEGDTDPLVNTVTVNYHDQFQQPATASASATVDIIKPDFTVVKLCTSNPLPDGGPATFNVTISNTGNVPLSFTTNEAAQSDTPEPFTVASGSFIDLTITKEVGNPCEDVSNAITVTANLTQTIDCPIQDIVKTSNDAICYCKPTVEVTKEADCDVAAPGKLITYTITITNTGSNPLTLDSVTDTLLGDITSIAQANGCSTLAADANCSFTVTRTVQQGDPATLDNMVSVVYHDAQQVQATDDALASVAVIEPNFTVTKTCTSEPIPTGGPATFNVAITNSGNVDLSFTTNEAALSSLSEPFTVPIGVTQNLTITVPTSGTSDVVNTITVTGVPVGNDQFDCPVAPISKTANDTCHAQNQQGCTPGFWKTHPTCWACYSPTQKVNTVFTIPGSLSSLGNNTLLQALNYSGGSGVAGAARILLRAAVAALLNACDPDVNYPLTVNDIIADVNEALASGNRSQILTLATTLDGYNNLGCPIGTGTHCDRVVVDGN